MLMFTGIAVSAISQQVNHEPGRPKSKQLKKFVKLAREANVMYIAPEGFKEIKPINNDTLSFDYALELPGEEFEVWFEVQPQKKVLADFARLVSDTSRTNEHPDSLYNKTGLTLASELSGGQSYFTTIIPPDYLARYNATEGKTYLLDLADANETKHYKYALLITLHKDRIGTIVAICFGNEKGSGFFKNIFKASRALKFKS
ncbi:MAG: hypothetical protein JST50_08225 [Bacteroidetes bacterium]|jgi:hypothetical protein|nr:hypothetical protein [Bacteroidota bacterium]